MQQTPKTITLKEARSRLKCGEKFIRAEMQRGAFVVYRINRKVLLVDEESFKRYEQSKFAA